MGVKALVERVLRRSPPLYRAASRVYQKIRGSFRLALSKGGPESLDRALRLAHEKRGKDPGDYYEFGVFMGGTMLAGYETAKELELDGMRFYGFDSFEGLPALEEDDKGSGEFFQGQFSCGREKVEKNLAQNGMDLERTVLVQGFYCDSLTEELRNAHPFRRAAVALLDCDLYSSTRDALAWLEPYLQDETILLFDDWESYGGEEGQPKAFGEFLEQHPRLSAQKLWSFEKHGRAFLLRSE